MGRSQGSLRAAILDNIGEDTDGHDNGGALTFGADGKLYASIGVFEADGQAMSWTSLQGKILRMNDDGSVHADNPHLENGYPYSLIYAVGFRVAPDISAAVRALTKGEWCFSATKVSHRTSLAYGWRRAARGWRGRLGCHVHSQPSPASLNPGSSCLIPAQRTVALLPPLRQSVGRFLVATFQQ